MLEHILAILTGTGRNGKGVFCGAVAGALGDYASTAEPDLFMHRENAGRTATRIIMARSRLLGPLDQPKGLNGPWRPRTVVLTAEDRAALGL